MREKTLLGEAVSFSSLIKSITVLNIYHFFLKVCFMQSLKKIPDFFISLVVKV